MTWIRNNLKIAVPAAVALAAVFAFLAFGVFGIHTKFIDDEVSEDGPVFASGAAADVGAPEPDLEVAVTSPSESETTVAPDATQAASPVADSTVDSALDSTADSSESVVSDTVPAAAGDTVPDAASDTVPDTTEPTIGEIVTLVSGSFGERSHPGSGTAVVLNDGSEQRFLRFEDDFATDNGPDLFVYLTTADADAPADEFGVDGQFVDLGRLKGNVGSQNYEIPVDVDLAQFDTVVVWCDRFSVAFTTADLA